MVSVGSILFHETSRGCAMKANIRALILLGSAAVVFALIVGSEPARSEEQNQNKKDSKIQAQGVVIGYIESRDRIVTIARGPKGSVYTVKSKDGKVLDAKLSDKEFETKYPDIHKQIKEGLAGNDASLRKGEIRKLPVQPPR